MRDLDSLYFTLSGTSPTARAADSPDGLPTFHRREDSDPLHDPSRYMVDKDLAAAINTAIILGRPMFVTGEPGTGKSDLAGHIAWRLKLGQCLRFEVKSTSTAQDLFYYFDNLRQFRDASVARAGADAPRRKDRDWVRPYLTIQGLGLAVLRTHEPGHELVERYWDEESYGPFDGPTRSVVLIDEVDKAPREMTNDLLNEIDQHFFRMVEDDGRVVRVHNGLAPLVVFTSNAEKHMPEAFLRRCVYHHLRFPDLLAEDPAEKAAAESRLREILSNRLGNSYPSTCALLNDCIDLVRQLRAGNLHLVKPPSIAELLDWLIVLREMGLGPNDRIKGHPSLEDTAEILLKHNEDRSVAKARVLDDWFAAA
jgi:MoxR-like ATPase